MESIDQKPLNIVNEVQENEMDVDDYKSDEEDFSVKKSTNLKVFKGSNSDAKKRLTRSSDLKKTETSAPEKLPVLTKMNIHKVPKGITITKTKKVIAVTEPNDATESKPSDGESKSRKSTPNSSPDSKPSGSQKFAVMKVKTEDVSPKNVTADSPKRADAQKVKLTKAQVAAMAKEGKIAVKGGQVFLRNGSNKNTK